MKMRIRTVKPEFFQDRKVCALPFWERLLFQSLWCLADREGRLEDDATLIKGQAFPRDKVDVAAGLEHLAARGLIQRYEVDGECYLLVPGLVKHQVVNHREAASTLPPPPVNLTPGHAQADPGTPGHARGEVEGKGSGKGNVEHVPQAARFARFYDPYPRHEDKAEAFKAFVRLKPDDALLDQIVRDITTRRWPERKFIPLPTTYLNHRRWEDEARPPPRAAPPPPRSLADSVPR